MTAQPTSPALPPASAPIDLAHRKRLHVIGVGGPGMSAIAFALAQMGHQVSGVDIRERQVLNRLRAAGVEIFVGHDRSHVHGVDAVTASSAIDPELNELDEARGLGIPTLSRAEMLASICAQAKSIAVAGTHGKTTTTSMLMLILAEAGLHPSFVIGGDVTDMGTGAQWSGGEYFVVEADESDGTHLELPLFGTVLTNIDLDHLDLYDSLDAITASFDRYLSQTPGPKVLCADDERVALLAAKHDATTYAVGTDAEFRAVDIRSEGGSHRFGIEHHGESVASVHLPLRGLHNVANAVGAFAMAFKLGVAPDVATASLSKFGGVARRFDIRGTSRGITFVDDYAHLPTEINAVLSGARFSGDEWKRIVAVFQPNRYNRMVDLWPEYADAFVEADVVVLTDIFPSGTKPIPGVTGKLVLNAVVDAHPETQMVWIPNRDELAPYLAGMLRDGDVCISMGCGDIASLPDEVLAILRGEQP